LSGSLLFGRSPFLKKKGAGLEFILSLVEGLQSCLPQKCGRQGFTLQSLMRHQTLMKKFSRFCWALQVQNNIPTQVKSVSNAVGGLFVSAPGLADV